MKVKKGVIPNILTCGRITGAILLIFTETLGIKFWIIYGFCGVTDVLDGLLARLEKSESHLGALLDSIADLMFYGVMLIKIMPELFARLPQVFWWGVGLVVTIRLMSYGLGFAKYKRLVSMHTYGNKLTGFMLFFLPAALLLEDILPTSIVICTAAGISSLEELLIHLTSKEYSPYRKTIFSEKKRDAA